MRNMHDRIPYIDAFWRAANYLSVGQIYLKDNPLLRRPLEKSDLKKRLLGHFGTTVGLNLIYAHANRLIQDTGAKMVYFAGPGHGGPGLRSCVWLEGVMSEVYPDLSMDDDGIQLLMKDFSWPGGVPSHVSPPTPGSIHEGGELGYVLSHAYGAVLDNPDLIALAVVGDGEAETGPLATSWHSNKFINRERDGGVLPILHLNGYKIAGPTVFGRMTDEEINHFFLGCGYEVQFVEGNDPKVVHEQLWKAMSWAHQKIVDKGWPIIVLRTPKGWTGPHEVDGKLVEGTFRSHQVPLSDVINNDDHFKMLEEWLRSYKPEELFDDRGHPVENVLKIVPKETLRMGANPHANGGQLLKDLDFPTFEEYAVDVPAPGQVKGEATRVLGALLRDIFKRNPDNFRIFCPDETNSNRLNNVFEVTKRTYMREIHEGDEDLGPDGRVMEVLSEHQCQGWLEGYLLTGRHGLFPCYEAFAMIVHSMLNQHAKWMKACNEIPWREPIASLNYLLSSHVWRQDHNGYSHQGPGFIESVIEKKETVSRIYLPPDANSLLNVANHCLKSRNYVNLIIAGKQPMPQWLNMEEAKVHAAKGASVWKWASDEGKPDVVMAAAGDTPTLEILAAIDFLKKRKPEVKIQMVNVMDLFRLMTRHPHGFDEDDYEELFPTDVPVIFAFHGHPTVIHELTHGRPNTNAFKVRGYIEEGTTTTPFDMVVCNGMSRYQLAALAFPDDGKLQNEVDELLDYHKSYIYEHGVDIPEVEEWKWCRT
ncbi:MAG: Xylulose-5-phosphate phosphoketolase [Chlamydiia bacterium]|nr:Xylulose-5-phosphate phosphoketolase [Chlamydiia bacterium]MCH9615706.1 Xylulose-5-phosphate phosphoketolase [Chlamydiia bacterium]MCH9628891.1 Xylulose-5-phosphate phosphoketolase [Chlamydiia bacterium]